MSEIKNPQITAGEGPPELVQPALEMLHGMGFAAIAITHETDTSGIETIPPGTIPYTLGEINSRAKYLSNEHLGEFWQEYLNNGARSGTKRDCIYWGMNFVAHPRKRGPGYAWSEKQEAEYLDELGLKVVRPRSLVGFSDEYAPGSYGAWNHPRLGDAVIEVGSFIDAIRHLSQLPTSERPYTVVKPTMKFFLALADKLEAQINADNQ